jgi:hypothetical protein
MDRYLKVALLAVGAALAAVAPAPIKAQGPQGIAAINRRYTLSAELHPTARQLIGQARVEWQNTAAVATDTVQLTLPWNTWRHGAPTRTADSSIGGRGMSRDGDRGSMTITRLVQHAGGREVDLTSRVTARAHDPARADEVSSRVPLDTPVPSGEWAILDVSWTAEVPPLYERAGVARATTVMTDWYPRVTPLEDAAQRISEGRRASHGNNRFEVELRVPAGWEIAAGGSLRARSTGGAGVQIRRYVDEAARDFAWVTGPTLIERTDEFRQPGWPNMRLQVVVRPEHLSQADRLIESAKVAIRWYRSTLGPLPWSVVTLVDAPPTVFGTPMAPSAVAALLFVPTDWFVSWQGPEPEAAVLTAFGDAYARMAGLDDTDGTWSSSVLATYLANRARERLYAERSGRTGRYFHGVIRWPYADVRWRRSLEPRPPAARALESLERVIGQDVVDAALRAYLAHPADFAPRPTLAMHVASLSGRDLSCFFDAVEGGAESLDYSVGPISASQPSEPKPQTTVTIRRDGRAWCPVDVRVSFDDGTSVVERWADGESERVFRYDVTADVSTVEIDPHAVLPIERTRDNNTWARSPQGRSVAIRWVPHWVLWLQHVLVTYALFV